MAGEVDTRKATRPCPAGNFSAPGGAVMAEASVPFGRIASEPDA